LKATGVWIIGFAYFGAKLHPANRTRHTKATTVILIPVLSGEIMVFIEWLIGFPVLAALPPWIVKRRLEKVPALLPPEDVEGLDFEDFAHPDIA
jgi:hypothetical protein